MAIHCFGHQRALLPVAIATTTKNGNQSMWLKFAQSFENIRKRVRCVGIIDKNLKLSLCRNQLQASWHLRRPAKTKHSVAQIDSKSIGRSQRRHRICDIKSANQRNADQIALSASIQLIGGAAGLNAIIRSAEICAHPHSVSDHCNALVDFVEELFAVAVINIYNCCWFALSFLTRESCEELHLGFEIAFHGPMKIEMVLRKICKDGDVPFDSTRAILRKRMRRNFHRRCLTTRVDDLGQ